jgi:hypothetical protein
MTTNPDLPGSELDSDDDAVFDELARRAGAALRRPAPEDGVSVIAHRRRRQQALKATVVGGVAVASLIGAAVVVSNRDDPDRLTPVSSVASTTPMTIAPTTTPAITEPVTSAGPDGLVIVAANPQGGGGRNGDLYLLVPGETPRMIVGAAGDHVAQQCPQLSTDGHFIAWGEGTATGTPSLQRGVWPLVDRAVLVAPIASDGTMSEPIVRVPVPDGKGETTCPQWAPDGSAVAYRVDGDVWITDIVGGTTTFVDATELPWSMAEVAWSSDSSRIAASEGGQVRIIDVATGASDVMDTGESVPRHLVWLPADQNILFATTDEPGDVEDIVVASVNGTGGGETIFRSLPSPGTNGFHGFDSPVLSPDGSRVAVVHSTRTCENGGCVQGPREILVIDLATFTISPIPQPDARWLSSVKWSPDGRRLLLSSIDGVFSIPVDAEGPTVTLASPADIDLEWSHDEITWQVPA